MRTGSEQALDSALEYARKGVRINLASHSNYLALGEICLGKGLTDQAGEAIERGIELNPNDADGLGFLVHALCLQGNPDEAIARIGEATWTNPSLRSERRAQTAMAHFVARRYAESVEAMEGLGDQGLLVGDAHFASPYCLANPTSVMFSAMPSCGINT